MDITKAAQTLMMLTGRSPPPLYEGMVQDFINTPQAMNHPHLLAYIRESKHVLRSLLLCPIRIFEDGRIHVVDQNVSLLVMAETRFVEWVYRRVFDNQMFLFGEYRYRDFGEFKKRTDKKRLVRYFMTDLDDYRYPCSDWNFFWEYEPCCHKRNALLSTLLGKEDVSYRIAIDEYSVGTTYVVIEEPKTDTSSPIMTFMNELLGMEQKSMISITDTLRNAFSAVQHGGISHTVMDTIKTELKNISIVTQDMRKQRTAYNLIHKWSRRIERINI